MAASTLIALADAVVASLNAGAFSLPFQAQRGYRPAGGIRRRWFDRPFPDHHP